MQKTKQPSRIKRIPVTREGFERLKKTMEDLQKERPQAVKNLAEARGMGDLSENGLYTAAKSRLRSIDSELFRLDIQIKLADIMESKDAGKVNIGSKVTVSSENGEKIYQIVGDYEANPLEQKISQHSPLGRALIGKKVGEIAQFHAPKGVISLKILSIG
jgi:transcription elongation factor GreA